MGYRHYLAVLSTGLLLLGAELLSAQQGPPLIHKLDFPRGDAAWRAIIEKDTSSDQAAGSVVDQPKEEEEEAEGTPDTQTGGGETDAPLKLRYIDIVRKGDLRRDQMHWTDGTVTEYWFPPKLPMALYQQKPDAEVEGARIALLDTRRLDESIFTWVSEKTFMAGQIFKGRKSQRYEYDKPTVEDLTQRIYCWIDVETHRPLAWSDGTTTVYFQFDQPMPDGPLVMPTQFAEAAKRYSAYYNPPRRRPQR